MAVLQRAMVLLLVIVATMEVSDGAVYKVGDSAGWTIIGNVDYKKWAATKSFQVGDVILFVYNSQFHNVMRVKHAEYKACNTTTPKATYTTGNDSITISNRGHHYFLCGVPGHCQSGQKVDINVPRISSSMAPAPSSTALPSPNSNPSSVVPSPSPSGTVLLCYLNTFWTMLGLALAYFFSFCL